VAILQKYNDGRGYYFILTIHNMCESFQVLDEGMRLLRENKINVGCPIPGYLVIELYYTGKGYIKDRAKHLGSLNDLLLIAARDGHTKNVEQSIEKGAKINDVGNTALLMAAYNGHTEIVKLLIEKGVDINARNIYGWTALACALIKGHNNIADWLKINGGEYYETIIVSPAGAIILFPSDRDSSRKA